MLPSRGRRAKRSRRSGVGYSTRHRSQSQMHEFHAHKTHDSRLKTQLKTRSNLSLLPKLSGKGARRSTTPDRDARSPDTYAATHEQHA
jgi:hypothetical protein